MINVEGVKKIADTFAMLAKQYPGGETVHMDSTTIRRTAECGTCACHVGWFAYAQMEDSVPGTWVDCGNSGERYAHHNGAFVSFDEGANCMATIAGFVDTGTMTLAEVLEQWAANNPDIWGNEHGGSMFHHVCAFVPDYIGYDISLQTVADHWRGVYERLCAAAAAT